MKIAILHNLYGEFSRGGAETAVAMMAADYAAQGHEVFLLTTKPHDLAATASTANGKEKIYYLSSSFYNLHRYPWIYRALWQIGNFLSWRHYRLISKILQQEKPDLVVTHNLMGLGWLAPLAIRRLRLPHEHVLHDIQLLHPSGLMMWGKEKKIESPAAKIYQALIRKLFSSPTKVSSPSHWLLNLHTAHGFFPGSQLAVQPFVWPTTERTGQDHRAKARDGLKRFLFIGQVEKQKGILLLVKTFRKNAADDWRLTVAIRGGGRDLARARRWAGDDRRIEFIGPLSYEATEKVKAAADCLIVPSLCYENSPTVIYGAHAAGLPVIAAAIGGIPELMRAGDLLFNPGDADDLLRAMREFAK
jgi:glycosyltransferase involved in cell wall biosynthesis